MSRELPFECPHGNSLGGHESFGYADARCKKCDRNRRVRNFSFRFFVVMGVVGVFDWFIIPLILGLGPMGDWR